MPNFGVNRASLLFLSGRETGRWFVQVGRVARAGFLKAVILFLIEIKFINFNIHLFLLIFVATNYSWFRKYM